MNIAVLSGKGGTGKTTVSTNLALAKVKDDIILFQKLCHSCGAYKIVCKQEALSYRYRETGRIEKGYAQNIKCIRGVLNVGEPMAVPVIKQFLENVPEGINIIDCSPGTSCNVVNTIKYAKGAMLVTEPTEFGFHDLKMAVELVKIFNIPFGIVINKDDGEDNIIRKYCKEQNIPLIGSIDYSKNIAEIYSRGDILYNNIVYKKLFDNMAENTLGVLRWN